MPEVLDLPGQAASPGCARGPAFLAASSSGWQGTAVASAQDERQSLVAARDAAVGALRDLAEQSDIESAAILEFQIEMLLDPMMIEPVAKRIDAGSGAASAWVAALDDYIAGFEEAQDEHVRARAADLLDMKGRVLSALTGEERPDFPPGSVFVGPDIAPSLFLAHDWSRGGAVVLFNGSVASHVAMLARSRSVPMVVGTGPFEIAAGADLLVDGGEGRVTVGLAMGDAKPASADGAGTREAAAGEAGWPAVTADGVRIAILANIDDPAELERLRPDDVDGIGLMRTEFLMKSRADLFNEERQCAVYRAALAWGRGKPVTIRLLDFGGDKPLPGEAVPQAGSALGLRGIRLLLPRPDLLRIQARALLRAAVTGELGVMLPMVTLPSEITQTRAIFAEEAEGLARRGIPFAMPPIGMMVEVPAAALMLDRFTDADFFSFGTNDLAQYLGGAARDNPAVSHIHGAVTPAVIKIVALSLALVSQSGKPVAICGDMAGDPEYLPELLSTGLRAFSMSPPCMPQVRARLGQLAVDDAAGEE